jgi:hypothetical protein
VTGTIVGWVVGILSALAWVVAMGPVPPGSDPGPGDGDA